MMTVAKYTFLLIVSVFIMLILRPISNPTASNSILIHGEVLSIEKGGGEGDILIRLKEDESSYYINRGLKKGVELNNLKEKLVEEKITIRYADHWSPIDPENRIRHITELKYNNQILYTEL